MLLESNMQICATCSRVNKTALQEIIGVFCFATRVHVQEEVDAVNEKIRQRRASKEDILIAAIYLYSWGLHGTRVSISTYDFGLVWELWRKYFADIYLTCVSRVALA